MSTLDVPSSSVTGGQPRRHGPSMNTARPPVTARRRSPSGWLVPRRLARGPGRAERAPSSPSADDDRAWTRRLEQRSEQAGQVDGAACRDDLVSISGSLYMACAGLRHSISIGVTASRSFEPSHITWHRRRSCSRPATVRGRRPGQPARALDLFLNRISGRDVRQQAGLSLMSQRFACCRWRSSARFPFCNASFVSRRAPSRPALTKPRRSCRVDLRNSTSRSASLFQRISPLQRRRAVRRGLVCCGRWHRDGSARTLSPAPGCTSDVGAPGRTA